MKLLRVTRVTTFALLGILLLFKLVSADELPPANPPFFGTIPPAPPALSNTDFECTDGYYSLTDANEQEIFIPNNWQLTTIAGTPVIHSARTFFAGDCDGSAHVERITGSDSIVIRAQDLETPPAPGKPFDIAFHQQISATVGGAYSLSGWMLSLCGGSAVPSDCPEEVYIAKMLGIDPTGGTDPTADTVIWTENRRNFWESRRVGWQQISVSAMAEAELITVFARINSPSQWHGNHAFIDALSLVRSPVAELLAPAVVTGTTLSLIWQGAMETEISGQSGSTHELHFDIQGRHQDASEWQDLATEQAIDGTVPFTANCTDTSYLFRVRARAEQPDDIDGAWPNHRYVGLWSDPIIISFVTPTPTIEATPSVTTTTPVSGTGAFQIFLPMMANQKQC